MKKALPYILIAIVILLAAGFYIDRTSRMDLLPQKESSDTESGDTQLKNYGPAADFVGVSKWLNTDKPISINNLKGKVVLVDFWTYSCINCIRTLPYITKWYDTYKDNGLVVIGVHTPEFAAEKVTENVERAIKQHTINYPVAQDNDFKTWNAYRNRYWPAKYLVDADGTVVYTHFGEGEYDTTEKVIRQLLGLDPQTVSTDTGNALRKPQTPEIYFGLERLEYFTNNTKPRTTPETFVIPNRLDKHHFALEGAWQFDDEKTTLKTGPGKIKLHFQGSKVYMVAGSPIEQSVTAKVDSFNPTIINISTPTLYTLFDSSEYGDHVLEITIPNAGFEAYTFTFGQ